ncbi:MAG: hypothetical protein KatS3mg076_2022 [Candidatus Binatia bacterium]|nr:MAG: hypothetical protein KatS3mg076_2022 [Candidatus Binatia bacterium]
MDAIPLGCPEGTGLAAAGPSGCGSDCNSPRSTHDGLCVNTRRHERQNGGEPGHEHSPDDQPPRLLPEEPEHEDDPAGARRRDRHSPVAFGLLAVVLPLTCHPRARRCCSFTPPPGAACQEAPLHTHLQTRPPCAAFPIDARQGRTIRFANEQAFSRLHDTGAPRAPPRAPPKPRPKSSNGAKARSTHAAGLLGLVHLGQLSPPEPIARARKREFSDGSWSSERGHDQQHTWHVPVASIGPNPCTLTWERLPRTMRWILFH